MIDKKEFIIHFDVLLENLEIEEEKVNVRNHLRYLGEEVESSGDYQDAWNYVMKMISSYNTVVDDEKICQTCFKFCQGDLFSDWRYDCSFHEISNCDLCMDCLPCKISELFDDCEFSNQQIDAGIRYLEEKL